jgi:hypothetical protein
MTTCLCNYCHKPLYYYYGNFKGKIRCTDFRPINKMVPNPIPGTEMRCIYCSSIWYILRSNGSLAILTDRGIMPSAPTGSRKFIPDIFPELSPQEILESEYKDPASRRKR